MVEARHRAGEEESRAAEAAAAGAADGPVLRLVLTRRGRVLKFGQSNSTYSAAAARAGAGVGCRGIVYISYSSFTTPPSSRPPQRGGRLRRRLRGRRARSATLAYFSQAR